jgi:hypothetical protein
MEDSVFLAAEAATEDSPDAWKFERPLKTWICELTPFGTAHTRLLQRRVTHCGASWPQRRHAAK